ncbi:hypothetical protein ACTRXD_11865 [Nitrospira sp. T9]|uniref:hypothetical protein n=1 Tax=unclassified Nitrospira TaxID=2652172 RepID=UPI003F994283
MHKKRKTLQIAGKIPRESTEEKDAIEVDELHTLGTTYQILLIRVFLKCCKAGKIALIIPIISLLFPAPSRYRIEKHDSLIYSRLTAFGDFLQFATSAEATSSVSLPIVCSTIIQLILARIPTHLGILTFSTSRC